MEPANLNPESGEEATLTALLRRGQPEIPDDGFTDRVMAALPPPARPAPVSAAAWLAYPIGGCAGLLIVLWRAGGWGGLAGAARDCGNALTPLATTLGNPWVSVALGIAVVSLAIARVTYRPRWRPW